VTVEVETVTLNVAVPGEVRVTEDLVNVADRPGVVGAVAARFTVPANPFKLVTVTRLWFVMPAMMVRMKDVGKRLYPGLGMMTVTAVEELAVALEALTRTE
jgi:hypothetical protein